MRYQTALNYAFNLIFSAQSIHTSPFSLSVKYTSNIGDLLHLTSAERGDAYIYTQVLLIAEKFTLGTPVPR